MNMIKIILRVCSEVTERKTIGAMCVRVERNDRIDKIYLCIQVLIHSVMKSKYKKYLIFFLM